MPTSNTALDDYLTKSALVERYPGLITKHQLDWLLRFRHENGLAPAVRRVGRSLVINVKAFAEWLESQQD